MRNFAKVLMPVVAFALASAGAVSSSNSSDTSANTIGWKRVAMNDCIEQVSCNNVPTKICRTSSGSQAFAKVGLDCVQLLYHTP